MENDKYGTAKYAGDYSESGFFSKIKSVVKSAGLSLIYKAVQLFYVAKNPNVPMNVRAGIIAALGYFISPIDLVPDFTPFVGYTDDIGAIGAAFVMAQMYITDDIKKQAKDTIRQFFGASAVEGLD